MQMTPESGSPDDVDPVDEAAAVVDARSPEAAEMIAEVAEVAQDEGRSADADDPAGAGGDRGGG
jgi:hypothetical protein